MINEKNKLIAELVLLSMEVQEKTGHAVFVRFYGHVETMDIEIAKSKDDYIEKIASSDFSTKGEHGIKRLKEVKKTLLGFLENGINKEELDYWIEQIYHYKF